LYVEDLKRGTNKDIGPKDIFEMGSKSGQGVIAPFVPLFIIMFKITQLRNCGINGCTVVEKNV